MKDESDRTYTEREIHFTPELWRVIDQDAERNLRFPEQQMECILSAHYGLIDIDALHDEMKARLAAVRSRVESEGAK